MNALPRRGKTKKKPTGNFEDEYARLGVTAKTGIVFEPNASLPRSINMPKNVAKISVAAVHALCVMCDTDLTDENGSLLIDVTTATPDKQYVCAVCGMVNRLPAKLFK